MVVAAVSAGGAVALLLPSPQGGAEVLAPRASHRWWWLAALVAAATAVAFAPGWPMVPVTIVMAALGALWSLWTRRRCRAHQRALQALVIESCQQLSSELSAGQPPGRALEHAADLWPALAPAAEAFRVGADVPEVLRQTAARLEVTDLRLLAAAWHMAHRTGQGLSASVDRVVEQLLGARATRRVVDGELASARATARLVAALPLVALAMGSGAGGEPVDFLLSSPAGWACLGTGLGLGVAGLWWIEAIAADVERSG